MGATIGAHLAQTHDAIHAWLQRECPGQPVELSVLPVRHIEIADTPHTECYVCDGVVTPMHDGNHVRICGATYWAFWSVGGQLHMVVAVGVNRDSLFQAIQDARLTAA